MKSKESEKLTVESEKLGEAVAFEVKSKEAVEIGLSLDELAEKIAALKTEFESSVKELLKAYPIRVTSDVCMWDIPVNLLPKTAIARYEGPDGDKITLNHIVYGRRISFTSVPWPAPDVIEAAKAGKTLTQYRMDRIEAEENSKS